MRWLFCDHQTPAVGTGRRTYCVLHEVLVCRGLTWDTFALTAVRRKEVGEDTEPFEQEPISLRPRASACRTGKVIRYVVFLVHVH